MDFKPFSDLEKQLKKKVAAADSEVRIKSGVFEALRVAKYITFAALLFVTGKKYIGDNIHCHVMEVDGDERSAIETYCFITATFTLANFTLTEETAHPRVGPPPSHVYYNPEDEDQHMKDDGVVHHFYYQWVPFVLALQVMALSAPAFLWGIAETKRVAAYVGHTHKIHVSADTARREVKKSAKKFAISINFGTNNKYLYIFMGLELFGTFVALGNFFLTNAFLGGRFFSFGEEALAYMSPSAVARPDNPFNVVFPKVGKCTWHRFGPSGSIVSMDSLCLLPINIVNEKVYLVLYLAYAVLCAVVCFLTLYHLALFAVQTFMELIIRRRLAGTAAKSTFMELMEKVDRGDLFMLWSIKDYVIMFDAYISSVNDEVNAHIKSLEGEFLTARA